MYGLFTYIWLISMINLGKYTSPMDTMDISEFIRSIRNSCQVRGLKNITGFGWVNRNHENTTSIWAMKKA